MVNLCIDSLFLIDIFVSFISAYYDDDFVLRDNISTIASHYMKGWFIIDLLAILPLELIF